MHKYVREKSSLVFIDLSIKCVRVQNNENSIIKI